MRLIWILAAMSFLLSSCATSQSRKDIADQKFFDIIAKPSAYEGQRVTLTAWITLRDEDQNLWASWSDHENWETRRCLSLSHYDVLSTSRPALDAHYVRVTGIVRSDSSRSGKVLRLASCQDASLEVIDASSVELVKPMQGEK